MSPSDDICTARAARPYSASGSSSARAIKLAKVSSIPRQFIELAPSGLVKRLVVLTPEHADLSREFSSSFLLRDLVDPGEASGQLLFDAVVWRFESAQAQFCRQIVHR